MKPEHLDRAVFPASMPSADELTRWNLASSAWHHPFRGIYADREITVDHAFQALAAMLVIPATAAVGGLSAAWFYGARVLDSSAPVEIITPPTDRFGPVKGLKIRTLPLDSVEIKSGPGPLRLTTPDRTVWDIARGRDLIEAVVALDVLAKAKLIPQRQLEARLAERGMWGRRRAGAALALMDGRSESPQESRLRVRLVLAGIPVPIPQYVVTVGSQFVARLDLAWPDRRIAVEYDGHWHASPEQLRRDRKRLNRLIAADWRVFHVTDDRLRYDFAGLVAELARALG